MLLNTLVNEESKLIEEKADLIEVLVSTYHLQSLRVQSDTRNFFMNSHDEIFMALSKQRIDFVKYEKSDLVQ
jgi:hypothetical protein